MKCKNCNENIVTPRNYCPYCRFPLRFAPFLPTSVNKRGLIVFIILLTLLITGIYAYKLQPAYISKNLQKENAALQSEIKTLKAENDGLKKQIAALQSKIKTPKAENDGLKKQIAAIKSKKKVQKAEKPKSGEIWKEPSTEMSFVWLEGSESGFEIGCGDWTSDCGFDESPRKGVKLDGFWIGQHEVTVKQWNMFVKEKNYQGSNVTYEWGCNGNGLPDFSQEDDHPVVCVTWNDAKAFADWLMDKAKKEGNDYRFTLPSEAQWEYACRSGGQKVKYGTSTGKLSPKLAILT
jgi:formylglycine-generating enzyme required for sulfatase activity